MVKMPMMINGNEYGNDYDDANIGLRNVSSSLKFSMPVMIDITSGSTISIIRNQYFE